MGFQPSLFFLLVLLFTSAYVAKSKPHDNFTDLSSLLSFKDHVVDPYGILSSNWTANNSFCSWIGITCSHRHQRVYSIELYNVTLQGTLSPHLGNLSFLSIIYLGNCSFSGSIPSTLGQLPRLQILVLEKNYLLGTIPSSLFNMSSLIWIYLDQNNLTGSLPSKHNHFMLPRLQKISLDLNQLTGQIPASFGRCRDLQVLDLSSNSFTGNIPTELGQLPKLNVLFLGINQLTGNIPSSLGNLSSLSELSLGMNSLVGSIPETLGKLSLLQALDLETNSLSGTIPSSLFNKSLLSVFYVAENSLSGALLSNHSLVMLPSLENFSVRQNQLTGHIPSSVAHCLNLQELDLSYNNFSGIVPDELGQLTNLELLDLSYNQLTGKIPTSLGNLTMLQDLYLAASNLEGEIPKEFGALTNLQSLLLNLNSLTGSIPLALLNASMLVYLELAFNNLSGYVPPTLGESMPLLNRVYIEGNRLTGRLDFITSFSNCRNLMDLDISTNQFDGFLPNSIGNLSMNFQYFSIYRNRVRGNIPPEFGNLSNLIDFDLEGNQLVGSIPSTVSRIHGLQSMHLSDNRITGSIPSEIGQLTKLSSLMLERNKLSGIIPDSLGNITGLLNLSLAANTLSSEIPHSLWSLRGLIEFNLSRNSLLGVIPPNVGSFNSLNKLDLSQNRFSGNIPGALGELQMLTYLDLSSNSFHGQIPQSIGGLLNIEYLNLSNNFLSGSIPNSLAILRYLNSLDLSSNNLEGQIPAGRVFSNQTISFLDGNIALCGAPHLKFPPCPKNIANSQSKRNLHSLKYILPPIAVILAVVSCLLLIFAIHRRRKAKTLAPTNTPQLADHRLISYHDLVRATNNFSQDNLVGRGCFGSVFKGCLDDGFIVAVKILNLDVEGASKSFDAECQVLGAVRHRNLIKIISTCSNLDFKALILEFMPNGSLDQWLYSENYSLSLLQRLNIMVDVSSAIEYLHHQHPHVLLHCDLKPSNILLDEEMVAHVSDFGIAKLLLDDSRYVASVSAPGTIGYIAPEYGSTGKISRMGDVYSFGIILLETITRKRPTSVMDGESTLRDWICKSYPATILDIVDSNLFNDDIRTEQQSEDPTVMHQCLSSIIELGLLCSRDSPKERISMIDVSLKLQNIKVKYLSLLLSIT